ncbi:hypothetical protein [Streptomyces turgidiscabies]|uniref:hypothetical protein n=1 Tax=Streptomyces turgidiscabies TaxID=85558 RepID=UPI0038F6BE4A
MEGKRGFVISSNGKIMAIADTAEGAQRYALWKCVDREHLGAKFRWTRTHKLMAWGLNADHWSFTGIEITPASYV